MSVKNLNLCMNCMSPAEDKSICPHCGYNFSRRGDTSCLPPGTSVNARYLVGTLKSKNGESAVYIGYDAEMGRPVLISEYFPGKLSVRGKNGAIVPLPGYEAQYKALFSEYVDICNTVKLLGEKGGVIPIENAFTANNTLYAVYSDTGAVKLEDYLKRSGGKLPLRRALKMFESLCETLIRLHETGELHRGISPQNVYINREGNLFLGGFALSAARTEDSELSAELYNGYSAPEQYSSLGRQGAWTDVYALAALFYRSVSGIVPPKPVVAGAYRHVTPLKALDDSIPEGLSAAVDRAMRANPAERTQTVGELASRLQLNGNFANTAATAVFEIGKASGARPPGRRARERENSLKRGSESGVSVKYVILALFFTVLVLTGFMWFVLKAYVPDLVDLPDSVSSRTSSSGPAPSVSSSAPSGSAPSQEQGGEDKSVPKFVGTNADAVMGDSKYQDRYNFECRFEFNDSYAPGVVYDQSPAEGTAMLNRGTVILYVSKGRMSVKMPDLAGMTVEEADEIFHEISGEIEYTVTFQVVERYDQNVEAGKIITTVPAPHADFDPRTSQIYVYVSLEQQVSETKEQSSSQTTTRRRTSEED